MSLRTLPDLKAAFETSIQGELFDKSFNPQYQEGVSFTVQEMRDIVTTIKLAEELLTKPRLNNETHSRQQIAEHRYNCDDIGLRLRKLRGGV